jgi:hypothetical protein
MTDYSLSPSLLRTYVEPVPSPTDPPGSGDFYAALGIAVVAWGRLEGHFTLTIVTILNIASHKRIGKKLPMKWERLVEVWRTAFETVPALAASRPMADRFIVQLDELAQLRNRLIHGYWELFDPGPPIRIGLTSVRAQKRTEDGLLFTRGSITLGRLQEFTTQVNQMNLALLELDRPIMTLRGAPPEPPRRL